MSTRVDLLTALDELDAELEQAFADNAKVNLERSRERNRVAVDELRECVSYGGWLRLEDDGDGGDINIAPWHARTFTDDHNCDEQGCYHGQQKVGLSWATDHQPHRYYPETMIQHKVRTLYVICELLLPGETLALVRAMNADVQAQRVREGWPLF